MKLYGIDFTSAPSGKKPITCAECELTDGLLILKALHRYTQFEPFEHFLMQPGPWVAAMDFPFSLPEKWVIHMGWPTDWEGYVKHLSHSSMAEFAAMVRQYREGREPGDKYHFRPIDKYAKACSPMMIDYTPVGRMFYQGAKRLLTSDASVLPFIYRNPQKIVVEGYPALIARRFSNHQSYKSDTPNKQTEEKRQAQKEARSAIVAAITSDALQAVFGFKVQPHPEQESWIAESSADCLDALLCAIQAAWAYTRRDQNYGIPMHDDAQQGWIADPLFLTEL